MIANGLIRFNFIFLVTSQLAKISDEEQLDNYRLVFLFSLPLHDYKGLMS